MWSTKAILLCILCLPESAPAFPGSTAHTIKATSTAKYKNFMLKHLNEIEEWYVKIVYSAKYTADKHNSATKSQTHVISHALNRSAHR